MKAICLRTEYLKKPIGIDVNQPRLFWNCTEGSKQTAYRILAVDEQNTLRWDSQKVESSQMTHISFPMPLHSGERIYWKVMLWDEDGKEGPWSEETFFEMGLLHQEDWKAKWVTGNYKPNKKERYPVDCFKKVFSIKQSEMKKARLYVTACGIYEGRLNGKRIGDFVLAPGITDYRKRIQYQVYDVLSMLEDGSNELTFELADGWYRGSVGAWAMKCYYGTETKLMAQLELTDVDGNVTRICSDESFQWSNDGPIRFADNKDGEIVEAYRMPVYAKSAKVTLCNVQPTASNNFYVTEQERFPAKMIITPSGKKVLDFGQNIAGYIEFTVNAHVGNQIFLRFGEMLDSSGEFTQKNIQCSNKKITTPLQQVTYFCKEGRNHYKTKFAIFGFQYVLLESEAVCSEEDFTAIAVYSDMEQTTRFSCSNPLLNRLVDCTLWSAKNNSADLPTDCPTRERHGWTGDAQIFFNTAGYLLDYAPFARKFVVDMMDWQDKRGAFPQIAPEGGTDSYMHSMNGSVGWADAGVMIPYRYWKLFGDERIIEENYEAMKRYAEFMARRCGKTAALAKRLKLTGDAKKYAVNTGQSYGEWAEPADVHPMKWTDMATPHPEVSTAYTSYVMTLMEQIALHLDKKEDAAFYRKYAEGTKMAYQELVKLPEFSLDTDRQACLVRPLALHLLDEEQTAFAKKRLIKALENYDWRLGTGFLSTPLILDVLSEIDLEAAYRLLENEQMPGWLFMPKSGANTIWEAWEGPLAQGGIASLDHYSKGACCEWLFRVMCGIQVAGKNQFIIAPRPGGHFTYAKTEYKSVYGVVSCGWKKNEDGNYQYEVVVPSNTSAVFRYMDGKEVRIQGNGGSVLL
jgi:alpha-L-rhamnosidase